MNHKRRDTRVGPQCSCGMPFWDRRHVVAATLRDWVYAARDWGRRGVDVVIDAIICAEVVAVFLLVLSYI